MLNAINMIYKNKSITGISKSTINALISRGIVGEDLGLSFTGKTIAIRSMSLAKQCDELNLELSTLNWSKNGKPEIFALNHFSDLGCIGSYCEFSSIKIIIKSLCLKALARAALLAYDFEDGIEFVRETYYIFKFTKQDEESISNIYNELRNISKNEFIENFKVIYSHKINQEYSPGITEEFASSMFDNVSRDLFIKICELIRSHESYYNGWPDLTLISNGVLKLVEIKTTDKLHDSQIKTIPMLTEKLGIDVSVLKLVS